MVKEIVVPTDGSDLKFEDVVRPFIRLINHNERESRTLAALRDTLLPKLLSGELRVSAVVKTMADKKSALGKLTSSS